jgi:hypothetical protein
MYSHKPRPVPPQCCVLVDGIRCTKPMWSAGRCGKHSRELRATDPAEFERISHLTRDERERLFYATANPTLPKWEYENLDGEAWLIRRQEYLDTHDVPLLTTWSELDDMMLKDEQENENGSRRNDHEKR